VAVVLADALYWTRAIAEAAEEFASAYAGVEATKRQLRVAGETSPELRRGLGALGWEVHDRWQLSAPEDGGAGAQ
jgi:hypothetical protein